MTEDNTLIGYITQPEQLIGEISSTNEVIGTISYEEGCLIGEMTYGDVSRISKYEGPYFTTPTLEAQLFETKNKKMTDDFTVNATPISDVRTIDTDGYTITVL